MPDQVPYSRNKSKLVFIVYKTLLVFVQSSLRVNLNLQGMIGYSATFKYNPITRESAISLVA